MTKILGIDPGASGALALLDTSTQTLVTHDMPVIRTRNQGTQISEQLLVDLLRDLSPEVAWIERVHSMPKQGVASSFSFGVAYGMARGAVAGLAVPVLLVTPNEWKREFRLTADKQQARVMATRLFPHNAKDFSRVRDHGRAEAALLCLFGAKYPM